MKRAVALVLSVFMLFVSVAVAEVADLSGYSDEELERLASSIHEEQERRLNELTGFAELKRGDVGDAVGQLQNRLAEMGFYTKSIDNMYGRGTEDAVRAFQERNDLEQTGIATIETQIALFAENAKHLSVNLVKNLKLEDETAKSGVTYVSLDDGRYSITGTAQRAGVFCLNPDTYINDDQMQEGEDILVLEAKKEYYISGCQICYVEDGDDTIKYINTCRENQTIDTAMVITPEKDLHIKQIRAWYGAGEQDGSAVYEPMISEGKAARYGNGI